MPPKISLILPGDESGRVFLSEKHDDYTQKLEHQLLAVTLSLSPTEKKFLDDNKATKKQMFEYLKYKLECLEYKGVIVGEFTEKKVPHVHGVLELRNPVQELEFMQEIVNKKGVHKYYIDNRMESSNVIKIIKNKAGLGAWFKYIAKTYPTPTVIDWLLGFSKSQGQASGSC